MPFDHLGFNVADFAKSRAFYAAALGALGLKPVMEGKDHVAFGPDNQPEFWIGTYGPAPSRIHIAFAAKDRAQVDAFYKAAMSAGGTDNGKPGLRPEYHPAYYGAFVLDPDGHNIEAVCHRSE